MGALDDLFRRLRLCLGEFAHAVAVGQRRAHEDRCDLLVAPFVVVHRGILQREPLAKGERSEAGIAYQGLVRARRQPQERQVTQKLRRHDREPAE